MPYLPDSESLELEELELELLELEESLDDSSGTTNGLTFGAVFKCSLKSAVKPPKPIEVKKLMANLVFFGSSRGNSPSKCICSVLKIKTIDQNNMLIILNLNTYASLSLAFNFSSPIYSANS